jgi:CDP-glycerol glycerophosphotransferase
MTTIPKVIHYCWFGGNPLPQKTLECIESWKNFCPEYQIKVWNEDNFDVHCCKYVEQAHVAEKWAFVADYARFFVMYTEGGIYLETDSELVRPIGELLKHKAFFGFGPATMTVPLCGTVKNSSVAKAMIQYYEAIPFKRESSFDLTTVNEILFNVLTTQYSLVHNNEFQILKDDVAVYPKEYFFSTDWETGVITRNPNLYVIHYADASWMSDEQKHQLHFKRTAISFFGIKIGSIIGDAWYLLKRDGVGEIFNHAYRFFYRALAPSFMKVLNTLYCNRRKVVFENFAGRGYGDNPKYIAEELLSRNLNYDLVWIVKKGTSYSFPSGLRTVSSGTMRELLELATAQFWVDNNRKKKHIAKSDNQKYIQTWHGFYPLKKMEKDAETSLTKEYVASAIHDSQMTDLMVSGCKARTEIYKKSFWYDGEIAEWGTPRNDIFFSGRDLRGQVYNSLGIHSGKKLVLYAPTFRDDHSVSAYDIDFDRLRYSLNHRFGGEWVCVVRLHPAISEKSSFMNYSDVIIDASAYPDIQELFAASDLLITDYSDCMFEFSLTRKTVLIYASDIESYTKGRNFYYDIHDLPFSIAESNEGLSELIFGFDDTDYQEALAKFFNDIGVFEKGTASKSVVDYIINNS